MIKKIGVSFVVLLLLSAIGGYFYFKSAFQPAQNRASVKGDSGPIGIHWVQSTKNDRAAMLLPVFHKHIKDTLWMQFDLGAVSSLLYDVPLTFLKSNYQNSFSQSNSTIELALGTATVSFDSIRSVPFGQQPKPGSKTIIGTLGTDVLEKTKALISFKNATVHLYEKVPDSIQKRQKAQFNFDQRRIFMDVRMNGDRKTFMWDTGSSAYDLITSKKGFDRLKSPSGKVLVEESNQLDRKLTVYSAPTDVSLEIAETQIPLQSVTYVDGFPWYIKAMFSLSGMEGMLGNNLFKGHSIYLDCANNELIVY